MHFIGRRQGAECPDNVGVNMKPLVPVLQRHCLCWLQIYIMYNDAGCICIISSPWIVGATRLCYPEINPSQPPAQINDQL